MSESTSKLAKELKELLGTQSNQETLSRVQGLLAQNQESAPVVVAVRWSVGQPEQAASVVLLSDPNVALTNVAGALRAGLAVVESQFERLAAQAQSEAAALRAQIAKGKPGEL